MRKISTVILTDEFSTAEVLKLFLGEFDNLNIIEAAHSPSEILESISGIEEKALFIVDLSDRTSEKLDLILNVSKNCPDCKILAMSDNPSVDLIIKVMRAGANEFIPIPLIKGEFFEGVNKLIREDSEVRKNNKCKIISVFSNKGGIGKTSLAANLAVELAKNTKENVA